MSGLCLEVDVIDVFSCSVRRDDRGCDRALRKPFKMAFCDIPRRSGTLRTGSRESNNCTTTLWLTTGKSLDLDPAAFKKVASIRSSHRSW